VSSPEQDDKETVMQLPQTLPVNQWYVVAESREVGRQLLARTICKQPLALYRTTSGEIVVLDDRCPHRSYPLSAGTLIDDDVQCGYHGLRFNSAGTCIWAPGQDRIPSRAQAQLRPSVDDGVWVWVWMGDPNVPDRGRLPASPWFAEDAWATVHGMEPLPARFGLLIDNLLDLSHETFLHAGFIGTPEVAETPITTNVDEAAGVVFVSRHMESVQCPPFYSRSTGLQTPIDRWQDIEYHAPGYYLLHVRVAPAGAQPGPDADHPQAAHVKVLYAITPIDDHNTLDFWAVCRDFSLDDADVDQFLSEMNRNVVLQDVVALSLIEQRLGDTWAPDEVSFKFDAGSLAARRIVASLR
jgi:phenylpropionate dioxygenase-like ring-hydroxylating dioxygenase large terminal subunit